MDRARLQLSSQRRHDAAAATHGVRMETDHGGPGWNPQKQVAGGVSNGIFLKWCFFRVLY